MVKLAEVAVPPVASVTVRVSATEVACVAVPVMEPSALSASPVGRVADRV